MRDPLDPDQVFALNRFGRAATNSPQHIALRVERCDIWGNLAALFALC